MAKAAQEEAARKAADEAAAKQKAKEVAKVAQEAAANKKTEQAAAKKAAKKSVAKQTAMQPIGKRVAPPPSTVHSTQEMQVVQASGAEQVETSVVVEKVAKKEAAEDADIMGDLFTKGILDSGQRTEEITRAEVRVGLWARHPTSRAGQGRLAQFWFWPIRNTVGSPVPSLPRRVTDWQHQ